MTLRETAIALYGADKVPKHWSDSAIRARVRERVKLSLAVMEGRYMDLVRA